METKRGDVINRIISAFDKINNCIKLRHALKWILLEWVLLLR